MPDLSILVLGGGLAGHLTVAALASQMGEACSLVHIDLTEPAEPERDALYGGHTSPQAYEFFRRIGLDEPALITQTDTSFSYGTLFEDWPSPRRSWVQSYHLPFQPWQGVPFHHYLTRSGQTLEACDVSAVAARRGVFAHPPEDARTPLSRAEYGYQFSAEQLVRLLAGLPLGETVNRQSGALAEIDCNGDRIAAVQLQDGRQFEADLFIDCTGLERHLSKALNAPFEIEKTLHASQTKASAVRGGRSARQVRASESGWSAELSLRNSVERLHVTSDPDSRETEPGLRFQTGWLQTGWTGNCVAIGQAACLLEPLTPAPMILLQRDIERMLELLPIDLDMGMERREYNRRSEQDRFHAHLFQQALFVTDSLPATEYWQQSARAATGKALQRKLDLFASRGGLVQYDLEPFNTEDWTVLHYGMGRRPERFDPQLEAVSVAEIERELQRFQSAIAQTVTKMPPHAIYLNKFRHYLEKKQDEPAQT